MSNDVDRKNAATRELYRFSGEYWCFPAWVEFTQGQQGVARVNVGAGVHLLETQQGAVQDRLKEIGAWRNNGHWWVTRAILDEAFIREDDQDVDPEWLVEWRPFLYREERRQSFKIKTAQRDRFFHEFCKLGWINDPVHAEALWNAFCQHIAHWLLNEQEPVDFGFFVLHAVPLRPNWKDWLLSKRIGRKGDWSSKGPWFKQATLDSQLTAFNRTTKTLHWSLEVEAQAPWNEYVVRWETARRCKLPWTYARYALQTRAILRQKYQEIVRLYENYAAVVAYPFLQIANERPAGDAVSPTVAKRAGTVHQVGKAPHHPVVFDARTRTRDTAFKPGTGDEKG